MFEHLKLAIRRRYHSFYMLVPAGVWLCLQAIPPVAPKTYDCDMIGTVMETGYLAPAIWLRYRRSMPRGIAVFTSFSEYV